MEQSVRRRMAMLATCMVLAFGTISVAESYGTWLKAVERQNVFLKGANQSDYYVAVFQCDSAAIAVCSADLKPSLGRDIVKITITSVDGSSAVDFSSMRPLTRTLEHKTDTGVIRSTQIDGKAYNLVENASQVLRVTFACRNSQTTDEQGYAVVFDGYVQLERD